MIVLFGGAMLGAPYIDKFQNMIIKSIEISYDCKDRGLTLHQCEHEVKVELQR